MSSKISKTDRILESLLTGDQEQDDRLRQAFALGIRHGQAADRDNLQNICRIDQTTRILVTLMRTQEMDLDTAMSALEISKHDKEIYRRIINKRAIKVRK